MNQFDITVMVPTKKTLDEKNEEIVLKDMPYATRKAALQQHSRK